MLPQSVICNYTGYAQLFKIQMYSDREHIRGIIYSNEGTINDTNITTTTAAHSAIQNI